MGVILRNYLQSEFDLAREIRELHFDESRERFRIRFEKAGWKFEGIQKALFLENDVPVDYYSYAITKFY